MDQFDELLFKAKIILRDDPETALKFLQKCISLKSNSKVYSLMGMAYTDMNKFTEAEDAFTIALDYELKDIEYDPNYGLALLHQKRGDLILAGEFLSKAMKSVDVNEHQYTRLMYVRADLLYMQKKYQNALTLFIQIIDRTNPSMELFLETLKMIYNIFTVTGDFYRLTSLISAMIGTYPDYIDIYIHAAITYFGVEKYRIALGYVEKGLKIDPENISLLLLKGRVLLVTQGSMEEIEEIYNHILDLKPNCKEALTLLGGYYGAIHENEKCAFVYDILINIIEFDYTVWMTLLRVYTEMAQFDEMIEIADDILFHNPDDIHAKDAITLAKIKLKEDSEWEDEEEDL